MNRKFRIIVGMLLLAIPLCMNAQVKPVKPSQDPEKAKIEKAEKKKEEKEQRAQERREREKREAKGGLEMPKISGFVQGMYQANLNDEGKLVSNTLRMRRVRMSLEGNLSSKVSYKIQGDFSRSPMLVDAFLKYKACDAFAIQIGQFKTPFTLESPINPINLEIFDYGESVKGLVGYDDVCGVGGLGRDIGVMATGKLFPVRGEEGIKYNIVDYAVGVFNGNGPTTTDNNNRKDIVGRLEVHPGLKALTLSGSYYYGKYYKDEINNGARNRWAAGAQYDDGNFLVRGEYLSGTTGYLEYTPLVGTEELYQLSDGFYAVAGYNFKFGKEGKKQTLMPVLRFEHFKAGDKSHIENGATNYYTAGINYWPLKSVNFKVDYSLIQEVLDGSTYSHRVVGILSYKF